MSSSRTHAMFSTLLPARLLVTARRYIADNSGATAIEYALLALIGVGIIMLMAQISGGLTGAYTQLSTFVSGG